jgi:hypothetical protein
MTTIIRNFKVALAIYQECIMKFIFMLFFLMLTSCSLTNNFSGKHSFPAPIGGELPEKEKLFQAMKIVYGAEIKRDWKTFWSYFPPSEQENHPLDGFLRNMKDAHHSVEYNILSITNEGEDKEKRIESIVEVKIQWITKEKNGYGSDVLKDYWFFANGRWYWLIRD